MLEIVVGILPGILFSIFFFLQDTHKSKQRTIKYIFLFLLGAIGSYLCYRLEMHYGSYFKKVKDSNYWEILFYAILGVAIFEEGYKWLISFIASKKEKLKRYYDRVLNAVFTSIGFATTENLAFYVIPNGITVAIGRMIMAIPSHIYNALWMGYFLEKEEQAIGGKKYIYLGLGLIFPTILHGLYNSFLYGGKYREYSPYYNGILVISSILLWILMLKKKQEYDKIKQRSGEK